MTSNDFIILGKYENVVACNRKEFILGEEIEITRSPILRINKLFLLLLLLNRIFYPSNRSQLLFIVRFQSAQIKMANWPQTYSQSMVVLARDLPISNKISSGVLERSGCAIPVICPVVDSNSAVFFGRQRCR